MPQLREIQRVFHDCEIVSCREVTIDEYKKLNGIILMSTHEEKEIMSCDRCLFLKDGRIIEINIDAITKNDICRLVISVEDSGVGMSIDKVNELLSIEEELTSLEETDKREMLEALGLKVTFGKYVDEYLTSKNKDKTPFASFIHHALKQKSMVTNRIYSSKNKLAGYSVKYNGKGLAGLKDYWELINHEIRGK